MSGMERVRHSTPGQRSSASRLISSSFSFGVSDFTESSHTPLPSVQALPGRFSPEYRRPYGVMAIPSGEPATGTVAVTVLEAVAITETVFEV